VVGFDDIRMAEFTIPPLTTVQMSQKELAKIAFEALLNEVEGQPPSHERHEYELTTSLVLRRSTALAGSKAAEVPQNSHYRQIPQGRIHSLGTEPELSFKGWESTDFRGEKGFPTTSPEQPEIDGRCEF
jgi:hypothetical protein